MTRRQRAWSGHDASYPTLYYEDRQRIPGGTDLRGTDPPDDCRMVLTRADAGITQAKRLIHTVALASEAGTVSGEAQV